MKVYYRPFFFFIVYLLATEFTIAQSISSVELQSALPDSYDGVVISPSAQFDFNNHTWSIGPAILLSYGDNIEQREGLKLSGIYLGYANYLHGRSEKFNLFHSFDLILQRIKDEQDSRYFNTASNSFEAFELAQTDKIVQLFANFGVLIKLSDKLNLSQTLGLGLNATFRSTTSPFNDFNDTFIAQDWLLKTGLSYKINKQEN